MSNEPTKPQVPPTVETAAPNMQQVMELLQAVTAKQQVLEAKVSPAPRAYPKTEEIDWTRVSEREVFDLNFPIPVIEHELPEYMTVYLKDNNYIARWVHHLPRHIGAQLAAGYQLVSKEDWDPSHPEVLKWNSEGHLVYDDVVALKVHKSVYYAALRRNMQKSMQIRGVSGYGKVKGILNNSISNTPGMESAINRGAMTFYGENAESATELHTPLSL